MKRDSNRKELGNGRTRRMTTKKERGSEAEV